MKENSRTNIRKKNLVRKSEKEYLKENPSKKIPEKKSAKENSKENPRKNIRKKIHEESLAKIRENYLEEIDVKQFFKKIREGIFERKFTKNI